MYRTIFDREIGTAPPSTVDVDRVIRRRRRYRRVRITLTGAAAGVTAVALVGAALHGLPGRGAGGERVGSPILDVSGEPSTSKTASGAPDPVAAQLELVLRQFLDSKVPGARYEGNRPASGARFGPLVFEHRHREAGSGQGGEDYYFATADVVDATGTGNIAVGIGRQDPEKFAMSGTCPDDGPLDAKSYECTPSTGIGGDRIAVERVTGTRAEHIRVEVVRAGGVAVFVTVTNNSRKGAQAELEYDRADAPDPPLSAEEARELALLPALTV